MIKGPIQEEDITIINIYAPNIRAPQYQREMLTPIKGEIDDNKIIIGDLISHSRLWIHQLNRISKETQTLNDTMDKLDLISIGHFTQKQ